jgi:hypothetical protein
VAWGGLPWTIVRTTQFYDLVDYLLALFLQLPVAVLPADLQGQPLDADEVAAAVCECVASGPAGRLPDMGGPEVQTVGRLAQAWLRARRRHCLIVPFHLPGTVAAGFRAGAITTPEHCQGRNTWQQWLAARYGAEGAGQRPAYAGRLSGR